MNNLANSQTGGPIPGKVRVRFAPSPTGSLHVGGARTHLFNWLYAKANNGDLVVRVEDTDQVRSTRAFEKMVMDDIHALELEPDESTEKQGPYAPYRQSERMQVFKDHALMLLDSKHAYRCFCPESLLDQKAEAAKAAGKPPHYDGTCTNISREESDKRAAAGEPFAVRMKAPIRDYTFTDVIRGEVTFKQGMVGDFILLRSNGLPVYNFSVVVDDYLMRISHVLRSEEHLPNTLRQLMILEGFGWPAPHFAHMSIVLGNDRKKLSKRHGAASVNDYLEQGILKDALVNFLALLGWSPSDNKEIRPLAEIVKDFRLEKLTKSPAIFDTEKLHWMNGEYIRAMPIEEFAEKARPFIVKAGFDPDARGKAWLLPVLDSVRGHLKMLSEIGPHLEIYFAEKYTVDADASDVLKTDDGKKVVAAFRAELEKCETPTGEWLDSAQNAIKASTGAKGKGLFFPLRACVTGRLHGPELKIVLPLIGKEEALRRVDLALQ
jgi:nondiscriminating glutamyl-tRNA synthetase